MAENSASFTRSALLLGACATVLALFLTDSVGLARFQAEHEVFVENKIATANPQDVKPSLLSLSRMNDFHPSWRYSAMATLVFVFCLLVYALAGGLEELRFRDALVLMVLFWICSDAVLRYRTCHVEGATWRGVEALVAVPRSLACFWRECPSEAKSFLAV